MPILICDSCGIEEEMFGTYGKKIKSKDLDWSFKVTKKGSLHYCSDLCRKQKFILTGDE